MDFDFRSMLGLAASWVLLAAMMARASAPGRRTPSRGRMSPRRRPRPPEQRQPVIPEATPPPDQARAGQPPPHPRLYFRSQDLPRLAKLGFAAPQYLAEPSFTVTYPGDTHVAFPLPPRQPALIENPPGFDPGFGHYPYWTAMARHLQARLESVALSYASTGDRGYARRAVEYLLALAEWQNWTDLDYGDHTCLDTCHLVMGAAFAYDACWDAMSPPERERVRAALIRLGLEPLARDASERAEHNLQMLRNAALGLGGLAILPEHPQAWDYAQQAKGFFRWWLDLRGTSPNTEGLSYTAYGLDHCLLVGAALAHAESDREIIEHPYVAHAVRWALYFWGPAASGLVNFCDASTGHPFEITMRVANKYLRDPYPGYYLQRTGRLPRPGLRGGPGCAGAETSRKARAGRSPHEDFAAVILHDPDPPVDWPPPWAPSARFANIGWAALRSGWDDDATLFAFVSSSSREGHCHLDANHFLLNCAGEWLATDAGYKSFAGGGPTEFSQGTAGHNSILIGGTGQAEKAGAITDFFTSPVFDYLVGDASRAYAPQMLWRFLRRVIYVRPYFFAMLDELETPEPKRFEFLLHTDAAGRYEMNGRSPRPGQTLAAQCVSLVKPGARLDVRFMEPLSAQATLDHFAGAQDQYPPYVTVRDLRTRESQRFLATLAPSREPAARLTLKLAEHAPEGRECVMRLPSYGALLFRAGGPGDSFAISLRVPADATYRVTAHFLQSPAFGDWQVRIDGSDAGATFSGYARDLLRRRAWDLGAMHLSRGSHDFSFHVTGKRELSSGYLVGVDDIELEPVAGPARMEMAAPARLRRLAGEGWVGVGCSLAGDTQRRRAEGARCRAYFRLTGADEIADRDVRTDAEAALVVTRPGGEPEIAAYRTTRVHINGREVIQASAPISFALVPGDTWSLTLESAGEAHAVLRLKEQPRRPSIPPSLARSVRYDPTAPALRIRLRPGSHTITWATK